MTVDEIIERFGADTRDFPEEAVRAAIDQREEVTPALLRIIEHAADQPAEWAEDPRVFSTVFALHLLAQFREQAAYRPVVRLAQCPPQYCDAIIGDFVTEGLPRCLASVFDGDRQPIHALIENPHAEEFARAAGVAALKNLVLTGALERTAVLEYYRYLLTEGLERAYSYVWNEVVCMALDLYPDGLVPDLERAFEEGLIDPMVVTWAAVSKTLEDGCEKTLARTRRNSDPLIEDTVEDFGWWACWHEDTHRASPSIDERPVAPGIEGALFEPDPLPVVHPVRTGPKVGRNDPCPCGSGKKYKKCCGRG